MLTWVSNVASVKAAAAIYAALLVPIGPDDRYERQEFRKAILSPVPKPEEDPWAPLWTPTLEHYTTYGVDKLVGIFQTGSFEELCHL